MKNKMKNKMWTLWMDGQRVKKVLLKKREGIDGILVTVGLCIIALLVCVVMEEQLSGFVETIVGDLTTKAQKILG